MKDQATKRVFKVVIQDHIEGFFVSDGIVPIAKCQNENQASLIVRCVNSHDELIDCINELIEEAEYAVECCGMSEDEQEIVDSIKEKIDRAKQALKHAEKGI